MGTGARGAPVPRVGRVVKISTRSVAAWGDSSIKHM